MYIQSLAGHGITSSRLRCFERVSSVSGGFWAALPRSSATSLAGCNVVRFVHGLHLHEQTRDRLSQLAHGSPQLPSVHAYIYSLHIPLYIHVGCSADDTFVHARCILISATAGRLGRGLYPEQICPSTKLPSSGKGGSWRVASRTKTLFRPPYQERGRG